METPATEGVAEQSTDTAELITPTLSYQTMSREDEDRLNLIKNKVLSTIPTGREALQLMEEYDVRVEFGQRPGSFYIDDINLIVINTNKSPVGAALTFIHEMLHATRYHKGMRVDAASLSREDYVANRLEEEAEGETRVIAATMELEAIGIPYFTNDSFMEIPYRRSFEEAVASVKAENGDVAEEELQAIGREAGKQGIIEALTTGYVTTSTTKEGYPSYYGQLWEILNR